MPSRTTTVLRSLKRAAPAITRTPSPLKRSFESFGAIAAMTSCTCRCTLAKSTSAAPAETPKARASARAWARLPAAISAFEGTQPVLRHSPPILSFSINTTDTPNAAAAAATERPPEPAPMTQMSGCKRSAMPSPISRHSLPLVPGKTGTHSSALDSRFRGNERKFCCSVGSVLLKLRHYPRITHDPSTRARAPPSARAAASPRPE